MATTPITDRQPWHLDRGRKAGEMGYLPGLDGVRALAVLGVLLYHGDLTWMQGGFLGVDVFFVLSGFLITTLITEEFERSGRINFGKFYLGRARRLLPALLLMLFVVGLVAAIFYRESAFAYRQDALASLLYVTNWWYIVADQSYFEAIGRPAFLQHLWSLAVEEQFYLIWPAIAFVLLKWRGRRAVFYVAIGAALLSTAWMIALSVRNGYPLEADPSRAYFGSDTHVMGLLLGAALAMVWRPGRLSRHLTAGAKAIITALGVSALLGVVWFYLQVGEYSPFLYRGGFFVLSAVVCVLIAAASHPGVPFGPILGAQPMRYIGQRSYGLYLWHWPIFVITRPGLDVPVTGAWNFALRMALTFLVAELSYRFVEIPIRRGAIGAFVKRWKAAKPAERGYLTRRVLLGTGVGVAALTLVVAGLATAKPVDEQVPQDVAAAIGIADGGPTEILIDEDPSPSPSSSESSAGQAKEKVSSQGLPMNGNGAVTAIGDSVMLGVADELMRKIEGTRVDAEVSRQAGGVLDRVQRLYDKGVMAPTVVIHTGTNGIVTEEQLREMLDILSDRERVVLVNTNVPRPWMKPNNRLIESVAADYPNVVIADWYSVSADNPEYFVSDGTHPQWPDGIKAFVREIMRAVGAPVD
ncbi:MAG: acetyltransferase [Actinomycetales bacterium]|nr:acetyltransferase [Actinomycetales bacterium]